MIGYLEGKIIERTPRMITLDVGGVGYRIFTTTEIIETAAKNKDKVAFWTHMAVRENAMNLFGFLEKEDRDFFELLIDIPGIGPKSALAILNVVSVKTLTTAVSSNNVSYLTKVSGIGRKTADKLILELKGKIGIGTEGENLKDEGDVVEALRSLGYGEREVRDILKKVPEDVSGTSHRVKEALKLLGKR